MSYRFLEGLATGGFSEVFAVEDPASALTERLVLKRLTAEMSARPEVREAFAAEAKILRELRHANVVTFRRCYFDERGRVCLLMEEVAGEPLDAWARRHAAAPGAVLDVFEDVLRAVDYLHHRPRPFLHLDLKPDNILVKPGERGPRPVLIDFGIARRSGRPGLKAYTPPYAAPEQQSSGRLGTETDVHALGWILAELVARLDLPAASAGALARVAEQARSSSRAARFADAGEMGLAFRRARRSEAAPAAAGGRLTKGLPRWLWAGAGGAVLVLGLAVLALRDEPEPPLSAEPVRSAPAGDTGRIEELLDDARSAARRQHFDRAEGSYLEAKRLAAGLGQDAEAARAMALELEEVRRQIDIVRQGGLAGERAPLLDERRLRPPRP